MPVIKKGPTLVSNVCHRKGVKTNLIGMKYAGSIFLTGGILEVVVSINKRFKSAPNKAIEIYWKVLYSYW